MIIIKTKCDFIFFPGSIGLNLDQLVHLCCQNTDPNIKNIFCILKTEIQDKTHTDSGWKLQDL